MLALNSEHRGHDRASRCTAGDMTARSQDANPLELRSAIAAWPPHNATVHTCVPRPARSRVPREARRTRCCRQHGRDEPEASTGRRSGVRSRTPRSGASSGTIAGSARRPGRELGAEPIPRLGHPRGGLIARDVGVTFRYARAAVVAGTRRITE